MRKMYLTLIVTLVGLVSTRAEVKGRTGNDNAFRVISATEAQKTCEEEGHIFGYVPSCLICNAVQPTEAFGKDGIYWLFNADDSKMLVASGTKTVLEDKITEPNGFHGVWFITVNNNGTVWLRDTESGKYINELGGMQDNPIWYPLSDDKTTITINGNSYKFRSANCDAYALNEVIIRVKDKEWYTDWEYSPGSYFQFDNDIVYAVKNVKTLDYLSLHAGNYKMVGGGKMHHQKELNKNAYWKFHSGNYAYQETNGTIMYNKFNGVHGLYAVAENMLMYDVTNLSNDYFYGSLFQNAEDGFYYADTENHNDYDQHLGINANGVMISPEHSKKGLDMTELAWMVRPIKLNMKSTIEQELANMKALNPVKTAAGCEGAEYSCQSFAYNLGNTIDAQLKDATAADYNLTLLHKIYCMQNLLENCYGKGNIFQNKATGKYLAVNRGNSYSLYGSDTYTGLENQFNGFEYEHVIVDAKDFEMSRCYISNAPSKSGEYYLMSAIDQGGGVGSPIIDLNRPGYVAYGLDMQYVNPDETLWYNGTNYAEAGIASFVVTDARKTCFAMNNDNLTCASTIDSENSWWKMISLTPEEDAAMKANVINEMISEVEAAYNNPVTKDITDPTYINKVKLYLSNRSEFDSQKEAYQADWDNWWVSEMMSSIVNDMEYRGMPKVSNVVRYSYKEQLAYNYARLRHCSDGLYAACTKPTDNKDNAFTTAPLDLYDANQLWEQFNSYQYNLLYNYNRQYVLDHRAKHSDIKYKDESYNAPFTYDYTDAVAARIPVSEFLPDEYMNDGNFIDRCHLQTRFIRCTPNMVYMETANPERPQLMYAKAATTSDAKGEGVKKVAINEDEREIKYVDALPSTLNGTSYDIADCLWQMEDRGGLKVKMNTVGGDSWATLYLPFSVYLPEDVDAYTAEFEKNAEETEVSFNLYKTRYFDTTYDEYDNQTKLFGINCFVGFILHAKGGVTDVELPMRNNYGFNSNDYETFYPNYHGLSDNPATYPYNNNILNGVTQNKPFNPGFAREDIRVLSQKSGVVGFYAPNSSSTMVQQNKCFININDVLEQITLGNGTQAKTIYFNIMDEGGKPTCIRNTNVESEQAAQGIYNIMGQRLANTQSGINIINGKKVLIK